jgi:hypothetical protein
MASLKDMRDELRALRKEHVKPVSRLKKADVASELEKLREARETTPPVASVGGAPSKKMAPATESIKKAKEKEFPVKPSEGTKKGMERKTARKAYEDVPKKAEKPKMSKAMLRAMMESMTSDEE